MGVYRFARPRTPSALDELIGMVAESLGALRSDLRAKQDPHPDANDVVLTTDGEHDHWPDFAFDAERATCRMCARRIVRYSGQSTWQHDGVRVRHPATP